MSKKEIIKELIGGFILAIFAGVSIIGQIIILPII